MHEYKHHVIIWCLYSRMTLVPSRAKRATPTTPLEFVSRRRVLPHRYNS
jgi:hypothetical protein